MSCTGDELMGTSRPRPAPAPSFCNSADPIGGVMRFRGKGAVPGSDGSSDLPAGVCFELLRDDADAGRLPGVAVKGQEYLDRRGRPLDIELHQAGQRRGLYCTQKADSHAGQHRVLDGDGRVRAEREAARAVLANPLLLRQALERRIEADPVVLTSDLAGEPRARQPPLHVFARRKQSGAGPPQQLGDDRRGRGSHDANADVRLTPCEIREARLRDELDAQRRMLGTQASEQGYDGPYEPFAERNANRT